MLLRVVIFINFNPRSDERSDCVYRVYTHSDRISIHAPTNGATIMRGYRHLLMLFQSTLRRTERLSVIKLTL